MATKEPQLRAPNPGLWASLQEHAENSQKKNVNTAAQIISAITVAKEATSSRPAVRNGHGGTILRRARSKAVPRDRARGGKAREAKPGRNLGVEGGRRASARHEYKDRLYSEIKLLSTFV